MSVKKAKVPFTIEGGDIVAILGLKTKSQICELCHGNLMNVTTEEIETNGLGYNQRVVIGTCDCGFHIDCMNSWKKAGDMNQNDSVCCPTCKGIFTEKAKIATNNMYYDIGMVGK